MALTESIQIPVNGNHYQYPVSRLFHAFQVQNLTTTNLNIKNLQTGQTVTVPTGATQTVNQTFGGAQIEVWTDSSTTGEAWIYCYDSIADLSGNPNIGPQQVTITNATLTVAGTVTATISGAVTIGSTVTVTGSVNANITNTVNVNANITNASIPVTGTVNATILNATITTQDITVETNTGILTGLLPSTTNAYTITNNQQQNITVPYACPGFGVTTTAPGFGRMNLWVTSNGQDVYLLRDEMFSNGVASNRPIEKRFAVPMAKNDVLHLRWDDASVNSVHVVRF